MDTTENKRTLDDVEVVLIGCGQMGSALAEGLIASGRLDSSRLICLDKDAARAEELADTLDARSEMTECAADARLWVVAVKPKDIEAAITERRPDFEAGDLIVSLAAGVTLEALRRAAGDKIDVVRAMPNTPALVGRGITGIMADGPFDTTAAEQLFESVGSVVVLEDETDFDALTALSGSGPAYVFTALEALADGAVKMGLGRSVARKLAVHTVAGAAAMVEEQPDVHTAELKDRVASPGGTTITGLATLEKHGFRDALISAVEAAARRSREMGE